MITLADSRNKYLCTGTVIKLQGMFYIVLGVKIRNGIEQSLYNLMRNGSILNGTLKDINDIYDELLRYTPLILYPVVSDVDSLTDTIVKRKDLEVLEDFDITKAIVFSTLSEHLFEATRLDKSFMETYVMKLKLLKFYDNISTYTIEDYKSLLLFYNKQMLKEFDTNLESYICKNGFNGFSSGNVACIREKYRIMVYICVGRKKQDNQLYFIRYKWYNRLNLEVVKSVLADFPLDYYLQLSNAIIKQSKNMIPLTFMINKNDINLDAEQRKRLKDFV